MSRRRHQVTLQVTTRRQTVDRNTRTILQKRTPILKMFSLIIMPANIARRVTIIGHGTTASATHREGRTGGTSSSLDEKRACSKIGKRFCFDCIHATEGIACYACTGCSFASHDRSHALVTGYPGAVFRKVSGREKAEEMYRLGMASLRAAAEREKAREEFLDVF